MGMNEIDLFSSREFLDDGFVVEEGSFGVCIYHSGELSALYIDKR